MQLSAEYSLVIALFNLRDNVTVEQYRKWSLEVVRPGMLEWDSVIAFGDYQQKEGDSMGDTLGFSLSEIIYITTPEEFIRDNSTHPGTLISEEWNKLVSNSSVTFWDDLGKPISS